MKINKIEHKLLAILYEANKVLDSFTLFRRIKITFPAFSKSIISLLSKGLIEEQGDNIKLTKLGIEVTAAYRKTTPWDIPSWRQIPQNMQKRKISFQEPYIPSIKKIDKRTFQMIGNNIK